MCRFNKCLKCKSDVSESAIFTKKILFNQKYLIREHVYKNRKASDVNFQYLTIQLQLLKIVFS